MRNFTLQGNARGKLDCPWRIVRVKIEEKGEWDEKDRKEAGSGNSLDVDCNTWYQSYGFSSRSIDGCRERAYGLYGGKQPEEWENGTGVPGYRERKPIRCKSRSG